MSTIILILIVIAISSVIVFAIKNHTPQNDIQVGDCVWIKNPHHKHYHASVEIIEYKDGVYTGRLIDGQVLSFQYDDLSNEII
jgi:hypothetical protein